MDQVDRIGLAQLEVKPEIGIGEMKPKTYLSINGMAGAGDGARSGVGRLGSGQMDPVEAVDGVVPVPGVGADHMAMDLGLAGASAALSGAGGAGRKALASRLARQRKWAKKREHKASP